MSLDFYLKKRGWVTLADHNITHNLNEMAEALGIYGILWRPEENGIVKAKQCIEPLQKAISEAEAHPAKYKKYDSPNGWGTYKHFIPWLKEVLSSCEEFPNAKVEASR